MQYLINGDVDEDTAQMLIANHDWDGVVEIILDREGPEWFFAHYTGQVYYLENGVLYF